MFKRLWTLFAAVFLLTSACGELPTEGPAVEDEEQPVAIEEPPADAVAVEAFRLDDGPSTICAAYRSELFGLQSQLSEQADDPVLRRDADSFQDLIAHTCR